MTAQPEWLVRPADESLTERLVSHLGCPPSIARLLVTRGIAGDVSADAFLNPTLDHLHDPYLLLGMAPAVVRIEQALAASEPILIYGDYDVDGTTATVLLKTAIERVAPPGHPAQVTYHVPHRLREGYGIQTNVLGLAATSGIRLVISVDTGIRAIAAAAEAKVLGLDLIVTDHHLPDTALPEAHAVINPAQPGCPYPNKHLCGAAVAFKLAYALMASHADRAADPTLAHRILRTKTLPSFLKLVALATIADSVPLTGENRAIATLGLRELANPMQPGLRALMQVAKLPLDRPPTAPEVAFRLAPRINAAGRMDVAADVVELFLTRDPARARLLSEKLDRLNQERRATEAEALSAIERELARLRAASPTLEPDCIILDHPDWHRGVLGILASRVVERTGRPALILTHQEGASHGSGRSIEGFHLLDALTAVHTGHGESDLFTRFGGHAHAVGFSLPSAALSQLRTRMTRHAAQHLGPGVLTPPLCSDLEVRLSEVNDGFHQWMERLQPFGNGAPEPIFLSRDLTLVSLPRLIQDRHLCLTLRDAASPSARTFEALGWSRVVDWPAHCKACGLDVGSRVDVLWHLRTSDFRSAAELQLELVALRSHVPCP